MNSHSDRCKNGRMTKKAVEEQQTLKREGTSQDAQ